MPDSSSRKTQTQKITLRANERLFVCGKTGTGKTYLMRHLTQRIKRLIVLDGKGTLGSWGLEPWDRDTRRALKAGEELRARVIYNALGTPPIDFWESVLDTVFEAGNVTVYVDEMYLIVEAGTRAPAILTALYTQGRELGIGMWAGTQRPAWIPLVCMSEAEHFFMFRLNMEEDRKRMSAFMGERVLQPVQDEHGFYYARDSWDAPVYQSQFNAPSASIKGGDPSVRDGRS